LQITLLYLAPSTLPALRRLKSPLLNQLTQCVIDGHPERLIGAKAYASAPRDKPVARQGIEMIGPTRAPRKTPKTQDCRMIPPVS
jgi:hypothetical protein